MTTAIVATCWICGSGELTLVRASSIDNAVSSRDFAITDHRYGVTGALFRCPRCSFLQCTDLEDVLRYYETLEDEDYEEGREERSLAARRLLNIVDRYAPRGRLVDIGAGSGILVEQASEMGYEAEGVEPSNWLHRCAVDRGLKVHLGTYPHADVRPGFSAVTVVDVIEHVSNPVELLSHAALQLAEDGVGLVVTPDVNSVAARVMGWKWWHFRIAHIGYFNRCNLLLALEKAGLAPLEVGRPRWYFRADYLVERLNKYLPRPLAIPAWSFLRRMSVPVNLFDSIYVVFRKARGS